MIKYSREICFLLCVIFTGLILSLFSYDERKVAALRIDSQLQREQDLRPEVMTHCSVLTSREDSTFEKFFLHRLAPPAPVAGTAPTAAARPCNLTVQSTETHRFHLKSYWSVMVQVSSDRAGPFLERRFALELPRPLCFLPLAIFLLALLFEFKPWGLGWTLGSYLFFLGGANFVHTTEFALKSAWISLTTDPTLLGLLLVLLWLALYRSPAGEPAAWKHGKGKFENGANRLATFAIGLWNPALFTAGARLLVPAKGGLERLTPFLDAQFFVACISLYLLTVEVRGWRETIEMSVLLPRYFSFTALLFLVVNNGSLRVRSEPVLWRMPRFGHILLWIALLEGASHFWSYLAGLPTLLRVSLALLASELVPLRAFSVKNASQKFLPWATALLIAAIAAAVSRESGIIDLALVLLEPRVHPNSMVLFTFLAGVGLGFLTGNFSLSFFALFPMAMKSPDLPLLRAALLDGILCGSLLSPFSIFNLLPVSQFSLSLQELIIFRFRQLFFPMVIGSTIYTVSSINSVAILQPVTFVFLCLVVVAFQLRKSAWRLTRGSWGPERV